MLNFEGIFVGNLQHDIGRLIICLYTPEKFSEIFLKAKTEEISLLEAEKKILGFSHEKVGE